jgi:four helix bundle protein
MLEGTPTIRSYRDLLIWSAAVDLAVRCYEITKSYPQSESYGMTSQIRRASTSIAANIAEGYGRDGPGQFVQFLRIAQGSLKELETHLIISERIGLVSGSEAEPLMKQCDELGRMLRAFIRTAQKKS